ncbi:MFS general substrate transporter [Aspergillus homomorphus CBS 101889]|uniref:MFS general substrate transporter n=1 Tax=Aspergillus homomorphus (strain CBS 101889) TaxID=1450537 RepID=A0A395HJQ8_ASPHC|nr:MFS general substrate transporter [Aspergillus homomorphus CBS 101889]RAL08057.1 MFS general substrate transporter [Aspergillus homomorphus CBS 101889]
MSLSSSTKEPVDHVQTPEKDVVDRRVRPGKASKEERRILHRVDRRLIVMLGFLHTVSLIDRGNLGTASVAGMTKQLHLVGMRYSIIAVAFFPPYICFQALGPVLVRRLGPVRYLSGVCLVWGAVMLSAGFVESWSQLVGVRIVIGALEAGFFPAAIYLISTWYTRFEIQKRYALFYLLGCVASAFTGLLSYGITFMNGLGGLTAWRWIFVIQGLITCVLAAIAYFVLIDFPDRMMHKQNRFLSHREYEIVMRRIDNDRSDATLEAFNLKMYLGAGVDINIWGFGLIYFCSTTTAYALSYFLPIIFQKGMGFSTGVSLCLFAPPYAAAGIVMMAASWVGDRYRIRGPIILFNAMLSLIGLPLMGFTEGIAPRLVGCFFTTIGANGNIPAAMAYQANNVRGQWKRAICSAIFVGLGASGGMTGSLVFRSQDAPNYRPGISTCIGLTGLSIVLVALLSLRLHYLNKKVDRGELVIGGLPGFKYTL